jgi:ATP-dependent DNA helicase DinG
VGLVNDTIPTTFAEAEQILAQTLPGYEARPQQQELALMIEEALADERHLLAEAGCGTGKSVGYLIPAILSGRRVTVSTATKALQDQIANKDLPFLAENLGVEFDHAILKGRSNYVCLSKLADADTPATNEVRVWIGNKDEDFDGERDNLPFEIDNADWRGITSTSDECPGASECHVGEACYAEMAKARAQAADIVVVNHALLLTDLMVKKVTEGRATMIGEYDVLVVDEAHELEDWATNAFGVRLSENSFAALIGSVRSMVVDHWAMDDPTRLAVEEAMRNLNAAVERKWEALLATRPPAETDYRGRPKPQDTSWRIRHSLLVARPADAPADSDVKVPTELAEAMIDLNGALVRFETAVRNLDRQRVIDGPKGIKKWKMATTRSINLSMRYADLVRELFSPVPGEVAWCEIENPGHRLRERLVVQSAPIEVADRLREMLWEVTPSVLVSATLSIKGSFDYIAGRLGIDVYRSVDVGTPFDYESQSALYVPDGFVSPKSREWADRSVDEIEALVKASDGRALLLFTSTRQMRRAHEVLAPRLPYQCLIQGDRPNKVLAEEFMADTHSVLFATRSFFTGVDFQGEACSLVVIDKLPFPVPTEPVTEARCEAIKARGGNDFTDFVIPTMSLILKQGYGRLIRHRNDRGVVAILDSRLNQSWGRGIKRSLPEGQQLGYLSEVNIFFGREAV